MLQRKDFGFDPALLRAWDAGALVVRKLRKDRKENPHLRGWASHREAVAITEAVHSVPSVGDPRHYGEIVTALTRLLERP